MRRGQKWNPLRQRLDSYNYTVEQHIIGSLLFTPLLLLLPTTSAFYIFFTIMNRSVGFICIFIEVAISIIHATPYTKIFLWLVRSRRFPCGIWFEIICCRTDYTDSDKIGSSSETMTDDTSGSRFSVLISFLHSNSLNIGKATLNYYLLFTRIPFYLNFIYSCFDIVECCYHSTSTNGRKEFYLKGLFGSSFRKGICMLDSRKALYWNLRFLSIIWLRLESFLGIENYCNYYIKCNIE